MIERKDRSGMALIVVLIIVMIASLVSLSFISRSDVELACGGNMVSRVQRDYLAESGLEHAKGLIRCPQDISTEYWTGAVKQQLVTGSNDYYDLTISKLSNCNYKVTSEGYKLSGAAKLSSGTLEAEVRLDPAVAFWSGASTAIWNGITVNGDTYCGGALSGDGRINGDAFARNGISIATANIQGGKNINVADSGRPVQFPSLNVSSFATTYYIGTTAYSSVPVSSGTYSGGSYSPSSGNPAGVVYCSGSAELAGNNNLNGTMVVNGDLRISGSGNTVTAVKNFPAILVAGNLIIEQTGKLTVTGLVVVKGEVRLNESATDSTITGSLCIAEDIVPVTGNASTVKKNDAVLINSPGWVAGKIGTGALDFNGSSQYLAINNDAALQMTSGLTIAAWIKAGSFSSASTVNVILRKGEINPSSYQLCIADRKVALMLNEMDASGVRGWTTLNAGVWYHVAATWDGTWVRIFINGNLDSIATMRHYNLPADSRDIYIGGRSGSDYFDGIVDDVQIYSKRKSDGEIADIMAGNTKTDLVGRWKFDENGSSNLVVTAAPNKAAIQTWPSSGTANRWQAAGGAFYKYIVRK